MGTPPGYLGRRTSTQPVSIVSEGGDPPKDCALNYFIKKKMHFLRRRAPKISKKKILPRTLSERS